MSTGTLFLSIPTVGSASVISSMMMSSEFTLIWNIIHAMFVVPMRNIDTIRTTIAWKPITKFPTTFARMSTVWPKSLSHSDQQKN